MISTKPNRCKHCKERMPEDKARHVIHDDCIDPWLLVQNAKKEAARKKKERAEDKVKKAKLMRRSERLELTQRAFNTWIRARDHGRNCISCGRFKEGQMQAGHFLSVGARRELRFEPLNCWLQCTHCNLFKGSNSILYRAALVQEIGAEKVEWLEGPHPLPKYTDDELDAMRADFAARTRALIKERE